MATWPLEHSHVCLSQVESVLNSAKQNLLGDGYVIQW